MKYASHCEDVGCVLRDHVGGVYDGQQLIPWGLRMNVIFWRSHCRKAAADVSWLQGALVAPGRRREGHGWHLGGGGTGGMGE